MLQDGQTLANCALFMVLAQCKQRDQGWGNMKQAKMFLKLCKDFEHFETETVLTVGHAQLLNNFTLISSQVHNLCVWIAEQERGFT